MSAAVPDEARTLAASPAPAREVGQVGVSASAYAALALCAIVAAKGIAPALPGTTTGIAQLISAAVWFAACMSQLVAAGGIALCIRLLGNVFALPSLGIGFRFLAMPAGISVVALVAAAATRPLDGELAKLLAISAVITPAAVLPFLFARRALREGSLAVALATVAASLDLAAYELVRVSRASDNGFALAATLLGFVALACDVSASVFALRAVSTNSRERLGSLAMAGIATSFALALAKLGASHTASSALVLMQRLLEALSTRKTTAIPAMISQGAAVFMLCSSLSLLQKTRVPGDVRAALSLMLLARTCAPAPIAALLSVISALLIARRVTDPHLVPESQTAKSTN
ncbi:MAG: hypothetical protein ACOY0T_08800 [Myxococcota bacterium]